MGWVRIWSRVLCGGLCLLLLVCGCPFAQEYHEEVFMELPVQRDENGWLMGPTAIGVDFEGNFSYLQGDLMSTYNFQGDRIRVALVQPGMDFCYDEQGNFYISWNCSGEVVI